MMSELVTIGTYSVFIASYVVFALGKFPGMKIDRPGAAIIGAVLMFAIGAMHAHDALQFIHFGPVAFVGLFLNWLVLWWLYFRRRIHDVQTEAPVDAVQIDRAALVKAGLVTVLVLAGFLAGFPPPLVAAMGAAIMLITRTRDPHLVYEEVDWGLLVFFVGLFLIVGGAENAGLTERLLGFGGRFNLQHLGVFTSVTAILSNLVSNVPAVMLFKSLATLLYNAY